MDYPARTPLHQLVYARLVGDTDLDIHTRGDPSVALHAWPESSAEETSGQQIAISGYAPGQMVPAGSTPIAIGLSFIDSNGRYRPFSSTFSIDAAVEGYSWTSSVTRFSEEALLAAEAYADPDALALPETVPERVGLLAREITGNQPSTYEKARALAWHLRAS